MSNTVRKKPTNHLYMRSNTFINYRRTEAVCKDSLKDYPHKKINRLKSAQTRVPDNYDDLILSYYRGQHWHRETKDVYTNKYPFPRLPILNLETYNYVQQKVFKKDKHYLKKQNEFKESLIAGEQEI